MKDPDPDYPINKISNIMFALGASGTGKTTRYFGINGTDVGGDKDGILKSIVKENSTKEVRIAYFVCYGRKEKLTNNFNEVIIFMKYTKNVDENKRVEATGYAQEKNNNNNVTQYTDFYVKLMNKKLYQINNTALNEYLENIKEKLPEKTNIDKLLSFREKLKDNSIWSDKINITNENDTYLNDMFEEIQKKTKTNIYCYSYS